MFLSQRIQRLAHASLRQPIVASSRTRPLSLSRHAPVLVRATRPASTLASVLQSKSRVSTLAMSLIVLAVGSTSFGLYQFYNTFTMWPKELRGDLRSGLKAKHQGDWDMSEKFLRRALDTALALPLDQLAPEPHLKLSGIAITLGGVLEDANNPRAAYAVYSEAVDRIGQAKGLTRNERLRAVAIAYKLGEMAETYQLPQEEEEKWLVASVEEMLRVVREEQRARGRGKGAVESEHSDQLVSLDEMELPRWVEKTEVVAPLQALGTFYSRVGKQEYAIPLFLSALSVLMPVGSKRTTPGDKCRGADVMNSLANTLLIGEPSAERREQAEAWVTKAVDVIENAKKAANDDGEAVSHCDLVLAAALFNHASLREMDGDFQNARRLFLDSRRQSSDLKLRDGVIQADIAVRRIDRLSRGAKDMQNK